MTNISQFNITHNNRIPYQWNDVEISIQSYHLFLFKSNSHNPPLRRDVNAMANES
ncbi:MAG TPA: hypothetical protein VHJ38_14540 [Nitrososphaeraceae archaeon]|nr:hypothetical protein [Nitrososphaeraceae archaeon]